MRMHLSTRSGSGLAGKLVFSAFGIFFAVFGCFFVGMTWNGMQQAKAMQAWIETPCTIVSSEMQDAGDAYKLVINYAYTFNGRTHTADRYSDRNHYTAERVGDIDRMQESMPPDTQTRCYVNPENTSEAVLRLPSVSGAFTGIAFTLVFPAVGMLFAVLPWLTRRKKETGRSKPASGAKKRTRRWFPVMFGGIFVLVGLIALKPLFITPMQKTNAAKTWDSVPATVISSKVKSHDSDDSTTYSVYIAYRYTMSGQEFLGDRYTFLGGSSSGYESKAAIVRQYPEGYQFNVYVNPADPSESVIEREFTSMMWFGLIPLIFVIAGVAVMIAGFRAKAKLDPRQAQEQIIKLKGTSPVSKASGVILFTLIWNGVVVLIFKSDAPILFHVVFGLFGLIMIMASIHAVLALFNPRPTVEITPGNIRPGTMVAMRWRNSGKTDRISRLSVTLQCLRLTTETSGSGKNRSTRTVKTPLYENVLLETERASETAQDTLQFTIPEAQPPSVPGNDGGIRWQLLFHGDIARWPDLKQELPFIVYPAMQR